MDTRGELLNSCCSLIAAGTQQLVALRTISLRISSIVNLGILASFLGA
jgi:hypothetical protein